MKVFLSAYFIILFQDTGLVTFREIVSNCLNLAAKSPGQIFTFSFLIVFTIILFIIFQARILFKTKHLLKDKEQAILMAEKHKTELEAKDKDITDSLVYAKRIQEALLPSEEYFRKHFRDSFIFYRPKDILSGDFYWIGERGGKVFIVAADCTGHGVPGALMSVIGLEIIEKTINEDNIENPSLILDILNSELEKTFSSGKNMGGVIRDGMDIGLCMIDKQNKKLEFAGAFFPLYLIRDYRLIEIKGDKLIIGMNKHGEKYTCHVMDLKEEDMLYLFSDGYVDQFGGAENRKFMYRRFRYTLMTIHKFSMNDQKAILEDNLINWMSGSAQVDDIMIIGIRPL
jgi:serine phosphatase RsbU (regulator of sigma subunit)